MSESFSLTFDGEALAAIESAAAWRNMTLDAYIRAVVDTASAMDGELAAFVQEGIDSADRGEFISQEEMEAWFEDRYRAAAAE